MNLIIMCLACVQRGRLLILPKDRAGVSAQNHRRETVLASVSRKLPASCLFISLSTPPQIHLGIHRPRDGLWLPFQQIHLQMVCCFEIKPGAVHSF